MDKNKIYYFMFSLSLYNMRSELEKRLNKKYNPNKVLVNGLYKEYTEMVDDVSKCKHSDAVIVASGMLHEMKIQKNNNY